MRGVMGVRSWSQGYWKGLMSFKAGSVMIRVRCVLGFLNPKGPCSQRLYIVGPKSYLGTWAHRVSRGDGDRTLQVRALVQASMVASEALCLGFRARQHQHRQTSPDTSRSEASCSSVRYVYIHLYIYNMYVCIYIYMYT